MFYQKHVIFCINQKDVGKKCCALGDAATFARYMKEQLLARGLHGPGKIRVSTSGCLGRCSVGPALVIYPDGVWYNYYSNRDVDRIIESHLVHDNPIEDLKIIE